MLRVQQLATGMGVLTFVKGDCCSLIELEQIFSKATIECVVHFAAMKVRGGSLICNCELIVDQAVSESVRKPLEYYHNNLTASLNLFRCMQKYGCKRVGTSRSFPRFVTTFIGLQYFRRQQRCTEHQHRHLQKTLRLAKCVDQIIDCVTFCGRDRLLSFGIAHVSG